MRHALERMREQGPRGLREEAHLQGQSPWLASAKLKLVDGCNLRCVTCDYWRRSRRGELTTGEVQQVLTGLQRLRCRKVRFTGGEPLLREDLPRLIRYAADLGLRATLTTNGTLLDRATIKALLKIPLRTITLSIDSPVRSVHDAMRGEPGAFARVTRTLDRILRWRGPKTRVRVNTVLTNRNYMTLLEMPYYLRPRPVDGWRLIPVERWTKVPLRPDADQIRRYNGQVAPVLAETIQAPGFDPHVFGRGPREWDHAARGEWALGYYETHPCHVPWFHTLVGPAGDVYPCCTGHQRMPSLGNVRRTPMDELFNGEAYVAFRRRMLQTREELCHCCDDFLADNRAYQAMIERWAAETGEEVLP